MALLSGRARYVFRILQPHFSRNFRCISTGKLLFEEKVTHTGQRFEETDWKKVRFIDKEKVVNPNIAQDLIKEEPIIEVDQRTVSCNGGGGALGHPKVFINLDKPGPHPCGYCGLRFIKKSHH